MAKQCVTRWRHTLVAVLALCLVQVSMAADSVVRLTPEQARAELAELYQRLQAAHFDLYARRSKAEYDALFQRLSADLDQPMTVDALARRFQTFVAYGKVAHARIDGAQAAFGIFRQNGGKAFPLAVRLVNGAMYVADNFSGLSSLARGDEVLAINGKPVATVLADIGAHVSADNDYMLHTLLELWLPAMLWQQYGAVEHFTVQLRRADGAPFDVQVPARTRSDMQAAAKLQAPLLALDWDQREARVLEGGIGYLRPGPFYNNEPNASNVWDTAPFAAFIDAAFTRFIDAGVGSVLIDLRDNPGGDNSFSDRMLSWFADQPFRFCSRFLIKVSAETTASNQARLQQSGETGTEVSRAYDQLYRQHQPGDIVPFEIATASPRNGQRYAGKVYLLINRRSYSNTVMVAAMAQDYGFATVLGEETADLASTYGAMEQFTLSRTGITVGYPKAQIIRPSGDQKARGVIPDLPITTPILETPDDPVLTQALQRIRASS